MWKPDVSITYQPLCPDAKNPDTIWTTELVGSKVSLNAVTKTEFHSPVGNRTLFVYFETVILLTELYQLKTVWRRICRMKFKFCWVPLASESSSRSLNPWRLVPYSSISPCFLLICITLQESGNEDELNMRHWWIIYRMRFCHKISFPVTPRNFLFAVEPHTPQTTWSTTTQLPRKQRNTKLWEIIHLCKGYREKTQFIYNLMCRYTGLRDAIGYTVVKFLLKSTYTWSGGLKFKFCL
jgi:hypothetical protein